jgi:hypothetical protein
MLQAHDRGSRSSTGFNRGYLLVLFAILIAILVIFGVFAFTRQTAAPKAQSPGQGNSMLMQSPHHATA